MGDFKQMLTFFASLRKIFWLVIIMETGGIRLRLVHGLFKHLQPVYLARIFAGNGRPVYSRPPALPFWRQRRYWAG